MTLVVKSAHISRIGMIADSHGSYSALRRSMDLLINEGADLLVHLGDFCDSVYLDELSEIFNLLQENVFQLVKGNNDYQVEKILENGYSKIHLEEKHHWLSFLKNIPVIWERGDLCFAHSLPYDSIRAFYEPVDTGSTDRAREIFTDTGYRCIFCGHSHLPVHFRYHSGKVTRESMSAGRPFGIIPGQRYIFIIGSAINGECGILDLERSYYKRLTL